jgi:hypothetical protein
MRRRRNPGETRNYANDHLIYEIGMVAGLVSRFERFASLLPTLDPATATATEREILDLVGRNADIESFAIHARVLIDFLYGTATRGTCFARDFFPELSGWGMVQPEKARVLRDIRERTGTEVAHLSYNRADPSPPWDYKAIWEALKTALRAFVEHADETRLGIQPRERIVSLVGTREQGDVRELVDQLRRDSLLGMVDATQGLSFDDVSLEPEPVDAEPNAGGTAIIRPSESYSAPGD